MPINEIPNEYLQHVPTRKEVSDRLGVHIDDLDPKNFDPGITRNGYLAIQVPSITHLAQDSMYFPECANGFPLSPMDNDLPCFVAATDGVTTKSGLNPESEKAFVHNEDRYVEYPNFPFEIHTSGENKYGFPSIDNPGGFGSMMLLDGFAKELKERRYEGDYTRSSIKFHLMTLLGNSLNRLSEEISKRIGDAESIISPEGHLKYQDYAYIQEMRTAYASTIAGVIPFNDRGIPKLCAFSYGDTAVKLLKPGNREVLRIIKGDDDSRPGNSTSAIGVYLTEEYIPGETKDYRNGRFATVIRGFEREDRDLFKVEIFLTKDVGSLMIYTDGMDKPKDQYQIERNDDITLIRIGDPKKFFAGQNSL